MPKSPEREAGGFGGLLVVAKSRTMVLYVVEFGLEAILIGRECAISPIQPFGTDGQRPQGGVDNSTARSAMASERSPWTPLEISVSNRGFSGEKERVGGASVGVVEEEGDGGKGSL